MDASIIDWLLDSDEPWTRYRTQVDLLGCLETDPGPRRDHQAMLAHPQVETLIAAVAKIPEQVIKRHNDAAHPLYALSTLVDFGLRRTDPGLELIGAEILARQAPEGAFHSLVNIPTAFGGTGRDELAWVSCDAPVLLDLLIRLGYGKDDRVQSASRHLLSLAGGTGWGCQASPSLGKFKGPGRRSDPCPIANVLALKAISLMPGGTETQAARAGVSMLLDHWENRRTQKYFLFGMGGDFAKLKYPFIWYDILHVTSVLSHFPWTHTDPRFNQMIQVIAGQANSQGRYTPASMYQAWKGWSFANKRQPSPWLTYLVLRLFMRTGRPIPTSPAA